MIMEVYREDLDIVESILMTCKLSKNDKIVHDCWNSIKEFVIEKQAANTHNCKCNNIPNIKVKKLQSDAILPIKMTKGASGFDVSSIVDELLQPGEYKAIPTGLCFDIPEGFEIQVRPRSGLAVKQGITVLNTPGTVDSDYKGEVKIILINHSKTPFVISKGIRIAQLVPMKIPNIEIIETLDIGNSERGTQGFGSTGL